MAKKQSEGRVLIGNRAIKTVLTAAFLVFAAFTIASAEAQAYTIEDNKVFVNNSRLYFSAYPHTLQFPGQVIEFEFMSKDFTGNIDIAFGFDTSIIRPRKALLYRDGVWNDVSSNFDAINYDYGNMDRWYYVQNIAINQDQLYNFRGEFNITQKGSGKYWVCAKPSAQTISQAIAAGNFLCLDPWWNVSFPIRYNITPVNNNANPFLANDTFGINPGTGIQYIWCNASSTFVYADGDLLACGNATSEKPTIIDEGNGSNRGVIDKDLVFFHTMSGCTGSNCIDQSIYGNDAAAQGGSPSAVTGKSGFGILSDLGVTRECYFGLDSDTLKYSGSFSIAAWYKSTETICGDSNSYIFYQDRSVDPSFLYLGMNFASSEAAQFRIRDTNSNSAIIVGTTDICDQNWHHIIGIYNESASEMLLYVDANQDAAPVSQAFTTIDPDEEWVVMAENTGCASDINGTVDNIMVWNRTLSETEVIALFNNTAPDNYSVAGKAVLLFRLNDPQNITYSTRIIDINFEMSDCDDAKYSLNGAANVTIGCANTTFTADFGQTEFIIYANTSDGTNVSETVFFNIPFLETEITYCLNNQSLFIREKDIADDGSAVFNDYLLFCNYGCSNWTWTTLGNPGCEESDFTLAIVFLAIVIIMMLILRGAFK